MDRHFTESDAAENGPGYIEHHENDAYASKQRVPLPPAQLVSPECCTVLP